MYLTVFLQFLFAQAAVVNCIHINHTYRLLQDKLRDYDKAIRPKINQSESIYVHFSFAILSVKELDEVNQKLSVIAVTSLTWTDDLLKWNPNDYGNMTSLRMDSSRFWAPNLVLMNSADMMNRQASEIPMILQSNGQVLIYPTQLLSISCDMDVTNYPWDRHICILAFSSQMYTPLELQIKPITEEVITHYYSIHGTWELHDSRIVDISTPYYTNVNVYLSFERKPRFAIVNMISPIVLLSFLSVQVFRLPPDSGERISYTLTMLLAIAVFLTMVGDNLPKTSTFMPMFSYYIICMLIMCVLVTLATIFNLRLFHANEAEPVPRLLSKVLRLCSRRKSTRQAVSLKPLDKKPESKLDVEKKLHEGDNANVSQDRNVDYTANKCKGVKINWKDVSAFLDKVFFLTFLILFIVATGTYFVVVFKSRRLTINDLILPLEQWLNKVNN